MSLQEKSCGHDALAESTPLVRFRALILERRMYARPIDGKLALERMRADVAGETR